MPVYHLIVFRIFSCHLRVPLGALLEFGVAVAAHGEAIVRRPVEDLGLPLLVVPFVGEPLVEAYLFLVVA